MGKYLNNLGVSQTKLLLNFLFFHGIPAGKSQDLANAKLARGCLAGRKQTSRILLQ